MDIFEEARSLRAMLKVSGMTQKKLGEVLGVTQSHIANKLRLLDFSEEAQQKIVDYKLSARHARTILKLKSESRRLEAIEKAHAMNMNVARCEIMVDCMLDEDARDTVSFEFNAAERIGHFEVSLESSLALLREFGIFARARREEHGEKIYYSICIG